ncbi:MAG: ABC transporter permease [Candidatus Zixiibacteriota bacterium]|nr:MAG: ABC transporter permease [candidate division Zixibacteria bacterium]
MHMFVKLAWRNIFRNKRRTIIAGTAIGIGLASLIFTDALMIGMEINIIESATSTFLGEGQIHRDGFRQTYGIEKTINNLDELVSDLKEEEIVTDFSLRTFSPAMISSPANVSSVELVGFDPSREKDLSKIDEAITEGSYFSGDGERDIVIGRKLAEILEVEIGDRVVVTVSQAETGELSQEMFRISGIFFFNSREMDRGMAFVRLNKSQQMLGIGDGIHEIALKFIDISLSRNKQLPFWDRYSVNGNEAVGWNVVLPQMESVFALSRFSIYIMGLILFGIVALVIINTLFMSLRERMFEFGVLRAVGTRPFGMARLIIFEAGALAVISIGLGVILGFAVTYIFTLTGIDYRGIEYLGVTFQELLYPVLGINQFIIYPLSLFILTCLVSVYPALIAARMSPVKAMRQGLL